MLRRTHSLKCIVAYHSSKAVAATPTAYPFSSVLIFRYYKREGYHSSCASLSLLEILRSRGKRMRMRLQRCTCYQRIPISTLTGVRVYVHDMLFYFFPSPAAYFSLKYIHAHAGVLKSITDDMRFLPGMTQYPFFSSAPHVHQFCFSVSFCFVWMCCPLSPLDITFPLAPACVRYSCFCGISPLTSSPPALPFRFPFYIFFSFMASPG